MVYKGTLSFYRRSIKTLMKIFENDYENFHRVRIETRKRIMENKNLTNEIEILDKICEGEDIRDFFLKNII